MKRTFGTAKRSFVFGALLLTLVLIISACGSPAAPTAAPAQPTAAPTQPTAVPAQPTAAPAASTDEWGSVTVKKGDTIKASFSAALTGDLAPFGLDMQLGAQMAAEQFGKDINGFALEIVSEDDLCSGPGGTTVANKIAANPAIVGHIGFMCSSGEIPGSEILDKARIVSISPSATAVNVTSRGLQSVFRTAFNDKVQGPADANFMLNELKMDSVALIHDGSPYGEGLVNAFRQAYEAAGGKIVGDVEAVTVGEKDFRATLTKIAANQPKAIFFGGFWPEAAVLVTQKAEVGLADAVFMGADGMKEPKFIETAGPAGLNAYASFGSSSQGGTYEAYVAAYKAKGGDTKNIVFSPQTYDAVNVLVEALKVAGKVDANGDLVIGRKALADAVRAVKLEGVTGGISFDANGDRPDSSTNVVIFQNNGTDWIQVFPKPSGTSSSSTLPDLAGRTVTVALENAYAPFNSIDTASGKAVGWDYDTVAEICKRVNCKPEFKETGWDGMITAVSQGQFDMAADGITITDERAKVVDFSKGYIKVDQRLMSRVDDNRFKNSDEAKANKTIKVGTQKGTTNFDVAAELWGESQVVAYDQFPEAVQALIIGDVDLVIIDDTAGVGYTGANKDKIQLLEGSLLSQELGFVFPKGSPLVAAFNAALDAMNADGTMETINQKWFAAP